MIGASGCRGDGEEVITLISESAFQQTVVELARALGYIVGFTHDARKSEPGEPDLRMVHKEQGRVLFLELKTEKGRLTKGRWNKAGTRFMPGQNDWAEALNACPGAEYYLFRPSDWDEIEAVLKP